MAKKWPEKTLQERLLWEEPFRELVKLVDYAGVKLDEFRPTVQPIVEKFGLGRDAILIDLDPVCVEMQKARLQMATVLRPARAANDGTGQPGESFVRSKPLQGKERNSGWLWEDT